ncbi:MAG: hypothetical protein EBQ92_00645 [Proteobacteria bacterium]|nr:hypothetical protein [Pseudomonadota bacterium]
MASSDSSASSGHSTGSLDGSASSGHSTGSGSMQSFSASADFSTGDGRSLPSRKSKADVGKASAGIDVTSSPPPSRVAHNTAALFASSLGSPPPSRAALFASGFGSLPSVSGKLGSLPKGSGVETVFHTLDGDHFMRDPTDQTGHTMLPVKAQSGAPPKVSSGVPPNVSRGVPPNVSSGVPPNVPSGVPSGAAANVDQQQQQVAQLAYGVAELARQLLALQQKFEESQKLALGEIESLKKQMAAQNSKIQQFELALAQTTRQVPRQPTLPRPTASASADVADENQKQKHRGTRGGRANRERHQERQQERQNGQQSGQQVAQEVGQRVIQQTARVAQRSAQQPAQVAQRSAQQPSQSLPVQAQTSIDAVLKQMSEQLEKLEERSAHVTAHQRELEKRGLF